MSRPKNIVTNTAGLPPLQNLILHAIPGGIERSEAVGQAQLVYSDVLPAKMSREDRTLFTALGGSLGAPVKGDPLFLEATLPAGWKKEATDHPMWSRLVDQHGRERATIFYKAAFYDRGAHMGMVARYRVGATTNDDYTMVFGCVSEAGQPYGTYLFKTAEEPNVRGDYGKSEVTRARLKAVAEAWLTERIPQWNDPIQSWEWDIKPSEAKP